MNSLINILKEDLCWADASDFFIKNGDIADTTSKPGKGFVEECRRRIESSTGDWKLSPTDGASLWAFEGENNDEYTWKRIVFAISEALVDGLFLTTTDFNVTIIPLSEDSLAARVDFSNDISSLLGVVLEPISVVYNLSGNRPYFVG